MEKPIRILLQTTIPASEDNWSIERFSLLRDHLRSLTDEKGSPLCQVVARNRESNAEGNDPVLSTLEHSDFDELWLFAVDTGNGITPTESVSIHVFRQRGGGSLITRDHEDLGSSICNLDGVGAAHYFHTRNPDPDASQRQIDDTETTSISWPNYHSGRNGDYRSPSAAASNLCSTTQILFRPLQGVVRLRLTDRFYVGSQCFNLNDAALNGINLQSIAVE